MQIEVDGTDETKKYLDNLGRDLSGTPMERGMRDAAMVVVGSAKRYAPVDTGRLRASITPEIRASGDTVQGVVGSNVKYAPFMELGTAPHFPPISALATWARRHGMNAYLVARAIARRGIKARRFLQRAIEDNSERIVEIINAAVNRMVG